MKLRLICWIGLCALSWLTIPAIAAEPKTVDAIAVDQFGWQPASKKIAMLAEAVKGQDAGNGYTPGGKDFSICDAADHHVVFTGKQIAWQSGKVDDLSGNKVWSADFSELRKPGTYYVLDSAAKVRSHPFRIDAVVYEGPLAAATKVFYYQRCGCEIPEQFGKRWTHAACHVGLNQERAAAPAPLGDAKTAAAGPVLDVSGGWHDAGDMNKYVAFTNNTLWDLFTAYQWNPKSFTDATNIPESGNGLPDLLDECKWELDWLLKMQRDDGGVNNRVALATYDSPANFADDRQPIYYTVPTTWATATFVADCARAARIFQPFDKLTPGYAAKLATAAERGWAYLEAHPQMSPADGHDGAKLGAAAADGKAAEDFRCRVFAAAELFCLTKQAKYRDYFDANYADPQGFDEAFDPLKWSFDPTLAVETMRAGFDYATAAGATPSVVTRIRGVFKAAGDELILPHFVAGDDPYRAFVYSGHYCWGSNMIKCHWGTLALMVMHLQVNPQHAADYRAAAADYLHYIHGRNPLSWCYLSNAESLGAAKSPRHPFHGWFSHPPYHGGADVGAAPGYLVGGPNQFYAPAWVSPPHGEPPMKAFKDWDTGWSVTENKQEASWEVTEPAIYYQAAYVLLASEFSNSGR